MPILKPKLGLSLMPSEDYRQATAQLFESNKVQVLEWSFDFRILDPGLEEWVTRLLDNFSEANSLIGHGVNLSMLSARYSDRQKKWLAQAREEFEKRKYIHASEHFGFSEGGPIAHGAPLAVPMSSESLKHGKEMLKRYADAVQCPVGLENLAFAFGMEDVKRQGEFIDQLLSEVDGFLLLDLHNIFCQIANFNVEMLELLNSYPLARVREIHLSGGSWSFSRSGRRLAVRRDTHDEPVPQEVFNLATLALKLCPDIQFVILERLAMTMMEQSEQEEFVEDFETLREILDVFYA